MQKLIYVLFLTGLTFSPLFSNTYWNNVILEIDEQEDVECFGEDSGYVQLQANGGVAPYNFMLDGSTNSSGEFEDLAAGDYTAVVTDQTGCTANISIVIEEPDELVVEVVENNSAGCAVAANGSFTVESTGGSGGYTYTSNGTVNTTGEFTNLTAGNYLVEVEDDNGCEANITVTIAAGMGISVEIIDQTDVDCFGNSTGAFQVAGQDGEVPYEYRVGATINDTGIFSNLSPGTYSVLIVDAAGCTITQGITISEPTPLMISVASMSDVSCFGANDGAFQISATGGTTDYTFSTANDSNSDGIFSNQMAGQYEVLVTDANGCNQTTSIVLSEPAEIITSTPAITNVDCFGNSTGAISITATGGTGGFTYTLNNQINTDGNFTSLAAGNYDMVVTDNSDCSVTISAVVSQPDELVGIVEAVFNINCAGTGTGAVDFGAMGGTAPFTFTLNGNANDTGFFENLPAGDYQVQIVDANNCATSATVTIEESANLGVNILFLDDVNCFGDENGFVNLEANGGSGNYSYELNGETNTSGVFTNLAPGDYEAFVTDDAGCSTTVLFTVNEPVQVQISAEITMPLACVDDENAVIQITGTGGVGDFFYVLDDQDNLTGIFENLSAGSYLAIISDENNCNESLTIVIEEPTAVSAVVPNFSPVTCNGESDGSFQVQGMGGTGDFTYTLGNQSNNDGLFTDLNAGAYTVAVTDGNDCATTIDFTVSQPDLLTGEIVELINAGCNMALGSVEIVGVGGNGGNTYTLNGETNDTGIFSDLEIGMYQVELMDENGCAATISFEIEEGEDIMVTVAELDDVDCFGEATGEVLLEATGGNGDLIYTLGDVTNDTGLFDELPAGNYEAEVSSDGGCTASIAFTIEQADEIEVEFEVSFDDPCSGIGTIQIIATGGAGDYEFLLNDQESETGIYENQMGGVYDYVVTDDESCMLVGSTVIEFPAALTLAITDVEPDTGSENGSFNVQAGGGTAPYTFSLDGENFFSTPPFNNLMFGEYTAYIMDANGCVIAIDVTVPFMSNTFGIDTGVAAMSVFPNPFQEQLSIELELFVGQTLHFSVYQMNGVKMQDFTQNFAAGTSNWHIQHTEEWSAGTYLLQVQGEAFSGYFKLIKW